MTTHSSLVQAAEVLVAHLTDHQLPEPVALAVTTRRAGRPEVRAQMRSRTVADLAAELLAWADTLATVTIEAWRIPEGDRVQLSIGGTLNGSAGVVLDVYGGTDYDPVLFVDLAPGQERSASLGELRGWAASASPALDGGELA